MKAMKIVAVILLVVGIGLIATGAYLSYFIEEQTTCARYLSDAERKSSAAKAAAGTPQEETLRSDASDAMAGAQTVCQIARQSKQNGMWMMSGGLISSIASVALLIFSRRPSRRMAAPQLT
jgi:Flp pilus assembly protein TadB